MLNLGFFLRFFENRAPKQLIMCFLHIVHYALFIECVSFVAIVAIVVCAAVRTPMNPHHTL